MADRECQGKAAFGFLGIHTHLSGAPPGLLGHAWQPGELPAGRGRGTPNLSATPLPFSHGGRRGMGTPAQATHKALSRRAPP